MDGAREGGKVVAAAVAAPACHSTAAPFDRRIASTAAVSNAVSTTRITITAINAPDPPPLPSPPLTGAGGAMVVLAPAAAAGFETESPAKPEVLDGSVVLELDD